MYNRFMLDLNSPLSLRNSFAFPLQNPDARKELLWGAALLLLPGVGWLLNMGHRIQMVHNMQSGQPCWPAWVNYRQLFKYGLVTFSGMLMYSAPGLLVLLLAWLSNTVWLIPIGVVLLIAAIIAIPGYMSHYCVAFDLSEVYNPFKALRRVNEGGRAYWHAWVIALCALALSFTGLLIFGLGFLVTSVWFWQVAGFSFATVFSQRFRLSKQNAL
jgi:hypothetical protein